MSILHQFKYQVMLEGVRGGSTVAEADTFQADCWSHDFGGANFFFFGFLAERQSLTDSNIMTFVPLDLNEPSSDLGTERS